MTIVSHIPLKPAPRLRLHGSYRDALFRESQRQLANGMTINHIWDADGRETVLKNLNAAGMALAVYSRTYDAVSNPLTVLELDGTMVTFGYDTSYQLTLEQRSGANAYSSSYLYDPVGNRLVENDSGALTTATYDAADQQTVVIAPTGTTTNTWDSNGNLLVANVAGALTSNTWDAENRLTIRQNPTGAPTTNLYSADGLRQITQNGASYTRFLWDDQNVLIEQDASGALQAQYTNDPGIWGGLASQRRSGASSFFGPDQQGSARILVSNAGLVTDNYSYKAFGVELQSGSGTVNPYRYEGLFGYYRDTADWMYVRARWLDAVSGRWASVDPMWPDEARYVYVGNRAAGAAEASGQVMGGCNNHWPFPCNFLTVPPPCVGITNGYYHDCKAGNPFACCASCVSAAMCDIIMGFACCFDCGEPGTAQPGNAVCTSIQCMNSCIAGHYHKHDTTEWKYADKRCRQCGAQSAECCNATVHAEQSGYTLCAAPTKCGGKWAALPQLLRELFAKDILGCCNGLKHGKCSQ